MLDYEILRLIWWVLLGVLLIGFAIMDGFDMGSAMLIPALGHNDTERRIIINTVGPVWEGNQVWLILGAGAVFAAWPTLYAVSFSGFYLAMFLALCALILRPVGFKFRGKIDSVIWRNVWDCALFAGGFVPALIFGVAVGNVLQGVPFTFDDSMRMTYAGTLLGLLNPFALLCGLASVAMLALQGAAWLHVKAGTPVDARARTITVWLACLVMALFALAGWWIATGIDGYRIVSAIVPDGPSDPLAKDVVREAGAWLANYRAMPWMLAAPLLVFAGASMAIMCARAEKPLLAFIGSSCVQAGMIGTAGVSIFPFLLPSSLNPDVSLTVWDTSSSQTTLVIMTVSVVIFLPLILAYTAWVYHVLRGKVTAGQITKQSDQLY
ncbi:MAG: cytochrome d ubiquinol oxidase subunit II [Alphaproteobacteria bacterium]|nr:cytochrome d ubiquinol oxidase subunit II [Alphaproteobacteria bacterium]